MDNKIDNSLQSHINTDNIDKTILIMSGKGGTGKTTFAVNLAYTLIKMGKEVLLFDADIHGPNIPGLLGIEKEKLLMGDKGILPINKDGMRILSLAFMTNNENQAFILRGPMKHNIIKQLLTEAYIEKKVDYLVVDLPPGTGDELLSIAQLIGSDKRAIIVGLSNSLAMSDLKKTVTFCKEVKVPILGLVENMAGEIFGKDAIMRFARSKGIRFLCSIPLKKVFNRCLKSTTLVIEKDNEIKEIFYKVAKSIV